MAAKKKDEAKNEAVEAVEVAATTTAPAEVKKEDEKPTPAPKVEIIRGRMPLPIVAMIKFGTDGETDGAVAAKFRTTNGKVSDIRKDKNFGYITKDYKPNADMIEKAKAYAAQLDDKAILTAVEALTAGTAEDDAALAELRKSLRPKKEEKKEHESAEAAAKADTEAGDAKTTKGGDAKAGNAKVEPANGKAKGNASDEDISKLVA